MGADALADKGCSVDICNRCSINTKQLKCAVTMQSLRQSSMPVGREGRTVCCRGRGPSSNSSHSQPMLAFSLTCVHALREQTLKWLPMTPLEMISIINFVEWCTSNTMHCGSPLCEVVLIHSGLGRHVPKWMPHHEIICIACSCVLMHAMCFLADFALPVSIHLAAITAAAIFPTFMHADGTSTAPLPRNSKLCDHKDCNNEAQSDGCFAFQRSQGCHACGKTGCWNSSPLCPYAKFGGSREDHADASLGDSVPHMR